MVSPSGFQAELGAGGLLMDDDRPVGYWEGMSNWGHETGPRCGRRRCAMAKVAAHNLGGRLRARLSGAPPPPLPEWKGSRDTA